MIEEQNSDSKIQDESSVEKPLLKKSRSKTFSVNPDIDFSLDNEKVVETKKKQSNWFVRSLKAVVKPIIRVVSAVTTPIKEAYEWFKKTRLGKLYQLVMSNAVTRTMTVATCALALAGVATLGPLIPAGLAIAGLVSVGLKAAIDTYHVRSVRKLEKENNLLIKNRTNKTIQDYLFKLDPELKNTLQNDLYISKRDEQKKSVKTRYSSNPQNLWSKIKSVLKAVVQNTLDWTTDITTAATTGNVAKMVQVGVGGVAGLVSDSLERLTIDGVRKQYKKQIDEERDKHDTPGYNNLRELDHDLQKQEIQTKTLKALISDKSYWLMPPKDKLTKFTELKDTIAKEHNAELLKSRGNILVRAIRNIGSVIKDVGISHNPFSKYNSSDKLKVEGNIALTKLIELDQTNNNKRNELKKAGTFTSLTRQEEHIEDNVTRTKHSDKPRRISI